MDERIKERLTGAAILVVIVVLLVPEVFRGDRVASPSPVNAEPGTPSLRSYTIELDGMAAAPGTPPVAADSSPTAATEVAPVSAPPAPATSAPQVVAPAAAPRIATAKPAPDHMAGGWVVQIASFSQRENAARMVQQAAKKGARLMVYGPDVRGLYRVRSAPQSTRQAAAALQARLKGQGYSGMVSSAN